MREFRLSKFITISWSLNSAELKKKRPKKTSSLWTGIFLLWFEILWLLKLTAGPDDSLSEKKKKILWLYNERLIDSYHTSLIAPWACNPVHEPLFVLMQVQGNSRDPLTVQQHGLFTVRISVDFLVKCVYPIRDNGKQTQDRGEQGYVWPECSRLHYFSQVSSAQLLDRSLRVARHHASKLYLSVH